ncbi:hypothetical protein ACEOVB_29660 [Pseudomonas aeruginosa]
MNRLLQTRQELRNRLRTSVAYFHGRRVFDAVVFELVGADGLKVKRTIAVLTGLDQEHDRRRVLRLARRLQAMGFSVLWKAFCHPMDGFGGTVRLRLPTWRD